MTITAAADGSSLGNPGPAGWGWYVDRNTWAAGGWPVGTNNMGELMAVLDLLRQSAHLDEPLHIQCDSQYVINSVTKWMPGWKRNGWVKKDRKPVLNVDLMKAIDEAMQGRTVTFEWVKGHAGHSLNEEADRLANGAATAYQAGGTPDPGPGFGAPRAAEPAAQPTPEPAPAPVEPPAEPDLFALFDEVPEPLSPTEAAIAGERALLDDAVRADPRRVAALLHPEWSEIGRSGRLYSRAEILAEISPLPEPVTLEVITAQQIDANTVHLVWRATTATAQTLRSSIWVLRTSGAWVQRFHQGTPAAQ